MTRKIIMAVLFTTTIISNYSFSSNSSGKEVSTNKNDRKTIIVCWSYAGCGICGIAVINPGITTLCLNGVCGGYQQAVCMNFATRINPATGKQEVDESSITVDYSSPELKAQIDEAALKADF